MRLSYTLVWMLLSVTLMFKFQKKISMFEDFAFLN